MTRETSVRIFFKYSLNVCPIESNIFILDFLIFKFSCPFTIRLNVRCKTLESLSIVINTNRLNKIRIKIIVDKIIMFSLANMDNIPSNKLEPM